LKANNSFVPTDEKQLRFDIKITDLSRLDNPYIILENKPIDKQGYLIFD